MQGMTGHGAARGSDESLTVAVEIRTVNHRNLDVELRSARLPADLELALKKLVRATLSRGKIEVSVNLELTGDEGLRVNPNSALIRGHVEALRALKEEHALAGDVTLDHLRMLPFNRAFELSDASLDPPQVELICRTVEEALKATVASRAREAEEVGTDLKARLATLAELHARVAAESASVSALRRDRLVERLEELALDVSVEPQRVAQEVVVLADRCDIAEELTRLGAYLERLAELLDESGPVGKKLDFTLQESLREVNTIGSKARELSINSAVIEMKTELERMREQTANME